MGWLNFKFLVAGVVKIVGKYGHNFNLFGGGVAKHFSEGLGWNWDGLGRMSKLFGCRFAKIPYICF